MKLVAFFIEIINTFPKIHSDGVSDEKDLCPRVYARSETGCPTLTASSSTSFLNSCLSEQVKKGKIINIITPICDKNNVCPQISKVV